MSLFIGLPADRQLIAPHFFHTAGEKYLSAITDTIAATPLIIPALADKIDAAGVLDRIDGLLLTGGYSNVDPSLYGGGVPFEGSPTDFARDQNNILLINQALQRGIPILGICRGMQELNVALGGSLHQQVHLVAGYNDHREDKNASLDVQYGVSHPIRMVEAGILISIWPQGTADVNSVHGQGIDRLADGLKPEAHAEDGLIEAVSGVKEQQFLLAVQWHPEWQATQNPFYTQIFKAFGAACDNYRKTQKQRQA